MNTLVYYWLMLIFRSGRLSPTVTHQTNQDLCFVSRFIFNKIALQWSPVYTDQHMFSHVQLLCGSRTPQLGFHAFKPRGLARPGHTRFHFIA